MITEVIVDNYMRVRHVDFEPKAGLNEISGENENGKSSLLSAIATMGGKGEIAWRPIHTGAEEARIVIGMDGVGEVPIRMIRTMKRKEDGEISHTLVIEGPGGARFPKPQQLLDAIVGEFSFDPLAILRMDAAALRGVLEKFVPGYDFAADKAAFEKDFEARTDVNRRLKDLKSQVAGISVPAGTPADPIDESELVNELQAVGEHNTNIETRKANRAKLADEAARFRSEADNCASKASEYRKLADDLDAEAASLRGSAEANDMRLAAAGPLPEPKDAAEIRGKIEKARIINSAVADLKRRDALIGKAETLEAEAKALTKALDDRKAAKADAVKRAKLPVDGLSFDDDGTVLFKGEPLEQASQAQKIRVSVAIAAALSPKLKVAVVKDGSLLDKKSWALLSKYADEHGLQVFIETVSSDRPTAIVIEDGRIKGAAKVLEAAE